MISSATLKRVKYFPELIPDTAVVSTPVAGAVSLLDLRLFSPLWLRFVNPSLPRDANIDLRLRADDRTFEIYGQSALSARPMPVEIPATEYLAADLFAYVPVTDVPITYGLWVIQPTVADKMAYTRKRIDLTPEEAKLADQLGLADSVEKGVLPLPLSYQLEREYPVIYEFPVSPVQDITTERMSIAHVPNINKNLEFMVLTGISAAPGTTAAPVVITIDRDDDAEYLQLYTYPLSLDWDLECFIPFRTEMRIHAQTLAGVSLAHAFRFTFQRCRLTNTLRVRWGLLPPEQAPGDLWAKVRGGVL